MKTTSDDPSRPFAAAQAKGPSGSHATRSSSHPERALLVGLAFGARNRSQVESSLAELGHLATSAGAAVVGTSLQLRARPDAATLIGSGKLADVARHATEAAADLVVFDDDLTPAQQRNIERVVERKTLDRTQLILDIFARRARTREGRLQVELAQLGYLLPRLTGQGVLLSRLGGGIGTRGPGETKLETDRRRIRRRIQVVRRDIEEVRRRRRTNRDARARASLPVVALVGYTNAGKSTLFNALTDAEAPVSSQLFMTLDPLIRRCRLGPGRETLLADTVGFIRKLPHALVAAFRATLEEVASADLLLHVMDAAEDDLAGRERAVQDVLREIDAAERPCLRVLNQIDRLSGERRAALAASNPAALLISARSGEGLDPLREKVGAALGLGWRAVTLRFPAADGAGVASVYRLGRVLAHHVEGEHVRLEAEIPAWLAERVKEHVR